MQRKLLTALVAWVPRSVGHRARQFVDDTVELAALYATVSQAGGRWIA